MATGSVKELHKNFGSLFPIMWLLVLLNGAMKPIDFSWVDGNNLQQVVNGWFCSCKINGILVQDDNLIKNCLQLCRNK